MTRSAPAFCAAIFLIAGLVLVGLTWNYITAAWIENGDEAANSILMQDAKHFHLLLGHYSRVGFNHPGPAILYVLAAGEALFHDALGWTSPLGGQFASGAFYTAFWIATSAEMIRRMGGGATRAVVMLSIILATLAWSEPAIFNQLWFPYLFAMPFLTFVLAAAAVFFGDRAAWITLAVSAGFLVNGHISFVGVCGITIFLLALALIGSRKKIAYVWSFAAAAIFALFLAPLAIRQILYSPGPVVEYAEFAGHNVSHDLLESLQFMGRHVSTNWFGLVLVGIALLLVILQSRDPMHRAMLVSAFAASLGSLFYVMRGVDLLTADYVLIYYRIIPALLIGLSGSDVIALLPTYRLVSALVVLLAMTIWVKNVYIAAAPKNLDQLQVEAADKALKAIAPQRAILDLSNQNDWPKVWATIVGVELRRIRATSGLDFCIDQNWHVLFANIARCGPADANARRIFVDIAGAQQLRPGKLLSSAAGLAYWSEIR